MEFSDKSSVFFSVIDKLQKNNFFRSDFIQKKHIKILSSPLISRGNILFSADKGIIWKINKPFQSKLIISENKITEISLQNGTPVKTQKKLSGMQSFYIIFQALFTGDIKTIRQYFSVTYQGNTKKWTIFLTPLSSPLNKIFNEISLTGDEQIKNIVFSEKNQDSTQIDFINPSNKNHHLSDEEEKSFEF